MTDPEVALLQLGILVFAIMLGFPVAYHADGARRRLRLLRLLRRRRCSSASIIRLLGEDPGYLSSIWAYFRALLSNRIFDLFVNQTYSVMSNDVLTAIPLFLFMGYIVERANIVDRLFHSLQIAARGTCRARSRWRRSSPARSSRPPPASSARW